ncbi:MAG TPA: uridine kinase, partial [Rugosimonospora sp.]|nr:uridine kinase [Rugosimonospora sp.]
AADGAPAAEPGRLADALVDPVRLRGHATVRVDAADFLRPASVRLEQGRTNPDGYYEHWYDLGALSREVLGPLAPGGTGRILPTFWNPATDRATRAPYLAVPDGGVLLLSGPLLLGAGLDLDLTVHCALSPASLRRRTPPGEQWTLPAFERYEDEVGPRYLADVVVRVDDPRHPAVELR